MKETQRIETIGKCQVILLGQMREDWPCYGRCGMWVLSAIALSTIPPENPSVLAVTHEPTGICACHVANTKKALKILARFPKLFGASKTFTGVMRKWKALPEKDKQWVRSRRWWMCCRRNMADFYTKEKRAEYNRERRQRLATAGMCVDCGRWDASKRHVLCLRCRLNRVENETVRLSRLREEQVKTVA
jgi:hypothetical protein